MPSDLGPAPADVSVWDNAGPWSAMTVTGTGPSNEFTVWRPSELGKDGKRHPIVLWGSGIGQAPSGYQALLTHWATHGFVVISPSGVNPGSGVDGQMLQGLEWLLMENGRAGSMFEGKLEPTRIASAGHSNGAIASVVAASKEPRVTTTIVVAGGDTSIYKIKGPIFLVGNENDALVNPANLLAPQYETTHAPIVYGIKKGVGHGEVMGAGGKERGYLTAWLSAQLLDDKAALAAFYAADMECTICKDATWIVERKNIPGLDVPPPPDKATCVAGTNFPAGVPQACKDCLCDKCPAQAVGCDKACWGMVECMVQTCRTEDLGNYSCATGQCSSQSAGYRGSAALSVNGYDCMSKGKCLEVCYP